MFEAKCYTVMIISTGNMTEERKIIRDTIYHWNEINSENNKIVFKVSGYDIDMNADSGAKPQTLINKKLVEKSDFAIAVFWNRLGKETMLFQSGSAEEIELHLKSDKKVLTYFSKIKVDIDDIDPDQLKKLKDYKNELSTKVNYKEFDSYEKLKTIIFDDLTLFAVELGKPYSYLKDKGEDEKKEVDINYELQRIFQYGGVPEINQAYDQQIPIFKTKINDTTKEIIINDIGLKLEKAAGDFSKIVKPMKMLLEYYDFIQDNQLEILGVVLDEFLNVCFDSFYSFAAEPYTRAIFKKINRKQYKVIRELYMAKMLKKYQLYYKNNPLIEKFLDFTSVVAENNDDEKEVRNLILAQQEVLKNNPIKSEDEVLFFKNMKKIKTIAEKLEERCYER